MSTSNKKLLSLSRVKPKQDDDTEMDSVKYEQHYNKNRQDFKELFLTINFNCLDKIEIVFNPWTSKNEWEGILNPFITKINKDLFQLKDSILKNTIKF